ncbi:MULTISPECIES: hypothetical protein [unclassified Neisseria]|uniref:hypothetical protein n=1 Tax=unclassified Neisseria TaxID=2623750 RepID=UPI001072ECAF|nr:MULTISPECIES: hypothetical protein [unclassified Neisseria]MBF0804555.1 hypothetical protein [Neisseria sp. 19428wB4_WF04]TFU40456.1 hypothetical protein E4T99_09405 [Neisseria sp. WF04]
MKEKIEVVFVGFSAESQISSVQQKIRDTGLAEMVKILPFQPLAEIYPVIDIMVPPSRVEGFAAAGRQKALASFTGEVMAKKHWVYHDLLGGR